MKALCFRSVFFFHVLHVFLDVFEVFRVAFQVFFKLFFDRFHKTFFNLGSLVFILLGTLTNGM